MNLNLKNVYNDHLLEHYHHPQNKGTLVNPSLSSGVYNPSCGDSVSVQARVEDGRITEAKFQATGCVISCAAASMIVDVSIGKTVEEVAAYDKNTMLGLLKIELGPNRLRCGLLALEAFHNGIREYQKGQ